MLLLFPLFCLEHIFDHLDPIADPFIENKFRENILSQWPYIYLVEKMYVGSRQQFLYFYPNLAQNSPMTACS